MNIPLEKRREVPMDPTAPSRAQELVAELSVVRLDFPSSPSFDGGALDEAGTRRALSTGVRLDGIMRSNALRLLEDER